jgi:hypothetical protein
MHLYGRSSSHFTRIPRIFAAELEVDVEFHLIRNLLSADAEDYGGHPALKMPTLQTEAGLWFGSLPICRELARCSELGLDIVWPEDLQRPVAANAQELVLTAMATEVGLIMGKASDVPADNAHQVKLRASLLGAMEWLEINAARAIDTLPPDRNLSFLEVSMFCLVEHLEFRAVLALDASPAYEGLGSGLRRDGRQGQRSSSSTFLRVDGSRCHPAIKSLNTFLRRQPPLRSFRREAPHRKMAHCRFALAA